MWMPHAAHCACIEPDAHGQRPVTRHPPSTATAVPFGASDPAIHASRSSPQMSACARSGKSAASHAHTLIRLATQAVEPQPRPSFRHHVDVGADAGLVAAEARRHHQPAQSGVAQRRDVFVGQAPERVGRVGVALEHRAHGGGALDAAPRCRARWTTWSQRSWANSDTTGGRGLASGAGRRASPSPPSPRTHPPATDARRPRRSCWKTGPGGCS